LIKRCDFLNRYTVAVIAAAGSGSRMGMDKNKLFLEFVGKPVLLHTLQQFQDAENIDRIIISTRPEFIDEIKKQVHNNKITKVSDIIAGGSTRQQSVRAAVELCKDADFIAIHDGARPLQTALLLTEFARRRMSTMQRRPEQRLRILLKRLTKMALFVLLLTVMSL